MKANLIICFAALALLLGCAGRAPLPPKAVELNREGAVALAQGDLAVAEARLAVALEYNPLFVEAWVNLGLVELRRGDVARARHHLEKAVSINPDMPTPHHALGYLEDTLGRGHAAEAHYKEALKVDPGFAPARANLARRLFRRGAFNDAREQFLRLTEVAPESVEGWAGLVECYLALDRDEQADEALGRAQDRFADAPALQLLVARQKLRRGDVGGAEALLLELTTGADVTRRSAAWAWLAVARLSRGDADGARAAAKTALLQDRENPVAAYALQAAK